MSQQVYVLGARSAGIVVSPERTAPGNDVTFQARLCANEGTGADITAEGDALKQADISSISRSIYQCNAADPSTPVSGPTSLTVSTVVSDTLGNGNEQWTLDAIGRNFADTVTAFDTAGAIYRVQYTFALTSGATIVLLYSTSAGGAG